jgi:hypothetical protein
MKCNPKCTEYKRTNGKPYCTLAHRYIEEYDKNDDCVNYKENKDV